jgi:hypothetical protein
MGRMFKRLIIAFVCLGLAGYAVVLATELMDTSPLRADIQNKCTKHGQDDPATFLRPATDQKAKVIHLTNEGEFADRCEFTDVIDEIIWDLCTDRFQAPSRENCFNENLNVREDADVKSKPKLIVLYIHGWMHSAADGDENLDQFNRLIKNLGDSQRDKQILGIYVTWNASTGYAFFDYFSFWSRQRIADRITQSAVVAKIVGTIGNVRGISGKRDHFVAIGHSFGARMLFAAVNAPLVIDTEHAYPKPNTHVYQTIRGPADVVLLLNPAFESARYASIDSFMRNEETFAKNQPPLLITVSTNNDWATRVAFPAGQMLGLSFDERALTTLGNYEPYYTHSLRPSDESCAAGGSFDLTEQFYVPPLGPDLGLCLRRDTTSHFDLRIAKTDRIKDPYGWSIVDPEKQKYNPFLLVHTTKAVIDNHGGIWRPPFSNWIFEVVKALDEHQIDSPQAGRSD